MSSRTCYVEICGRETAVDVEFEIKSMGSGPSYSPIYGADGGDAPEIEILSVAYLDCPDRGDITDLLNELRDLSLPFKPDGSLPYGYGFQIIHAFDRGELPWVIFNAKRTLLEVVEEQIYENLHEHSNDGFDGDDWI